MKRPLKSRAWFYRPGAWSANSWWKVVHLGADEFDWHVITIGTFLTGTVSFAYRPCEYTGDCAEMLEFYEEGSLNVKPDWPVDMYGHNHIDPNCQCWLCLDADD